MKMRFKYEIINYWGKKDDCHLVEVPELDGCKSDGQTYQEALSNVETIIGEWIETAKLMGRTIPKAKGKLMHAYIEAENMTLIQIIHQKTNLICLKN